MSRADHGSVISQVSVVRPWRPVLSSGQYVYDFIGVQDNLFWGKCRLPVAVYCSNFHLCLWSRRLSETFKLMTFQNCIRWSLVQLLPFLNWFCNPPVVVSQYQSLFVMTGGCWKLSLSCCRPLVYGILTLTKFACKKFVV